MWYEKNRKEALRFDLPIFAKSTKEEGESVFMLIRHQDGSHDWLNLRNGEYNSSMNWKSPDVAVSAYDGFGYRVFNADLYSIIREEKLCPA